MEEVCGSKFANWVAAWKIGFIDKVYECLVVTHNFDFVAQQVMMKHFQ